MYSEIRQCPYDLAVIALDTPTFGGLVPFSYGIYLFYDDFENLDDPTAAKQIVRHAADTIEDDPQTNWDIIFLGWQSVVNLADGGNSVFDHDDELESIDDGDCTQGSFDIQNTAASTDLPINREGYFISIEFKCDDTDFIEQGNRRLLEYGGASLHFDGTGRELIYEWSDGSFMTWPWANDFDADEICDDEWHFVTIMWDGTITTTAVTTASTSNARRLFFDGEERGIRIENIKYFLK